MRPETLERLLIDRAVGELSDDVNELLDAWLAGPPNAGVEFAETVALAQQALRPAKPVVLPPPTYSAKRHVTWRVPVWAVGMAACFVAGLAVARLGSHPPQLAKAEPPARVAQAAPSSPAAPHVEVIWKSPVRMPEIKVVL